MSQTIETLLSGQACKVSSETLPQSVAVFYLFHTTPCHFASSITLFIYLFFKLWFQFLAQWHGSSISCLCVSACCPLLHAERLHCAHGLSRLCSFLHPSQRACARFFWLHCSKVASVIPFSLWNLREFLRIYSDTDVLTVSKRICSLLMRSYVKHHRRDEGLNIIRVLWSRNFVSSQSTTLILVQELSLISAGCWYSGPNYFIIIVMTSY